jgi:hypothetical protein
MKPGPVLAVMLVLVAACASAPARYLTSIEPLVGNWSGTVDLGGPVVFFYLSINADQTLAAHWGLNSSFGRITIEHGEAAYQMSPPPLEGTLRLDEEDGTPTLHMDDLFARFHAVVTRRR